MGENSTLQRKKPISAGAPITAIGPKLTRRFYELPTEQVAHDLLGMLLLRRTRTGPVGGRIVETEAYLGEKDPASHSYGGQTRRNSSMFGDPGRSYMYFIYGVHHCFNVVTGRGEAILIRAIEPLFGIESMRRRRPKSSLRDLCRGPGRLARALGLDLAHDGSCLVDGEISVHRPGRELRNAFSVARSPRIGITKAADLPLRFFIEDSPFVSAR